MISPLSPYQQMHLRCCQIRSSHSQSEFLPALLWQELMISLSFHAISPPLCLPFRHVDHVLNITPPHLSDMPMLLYDLHLLPTVAFYKTYHSHNNIHSSPSRLYAFHTSGPIYSYSHKKVYIFILCFIIVKIVFSFFAPQQLGNSCHD